MGCPEELARRRGPAARGWPPARGARTRHTLGGVDEPEPRGTRRPAQRSRQASGERDERDGDRRTSMRSGRSRPSDDFGYRPCGQMYCARLSGCATLYRRNRSQSGQEQGDDHRGREVGRRQAACRAAAPSSRPRAGAGARGAGRRRTRSGPRQSAAPPPSGAASRSTARRAGARRCRARRRGRLRLAGYLAVWSHWMSEPLSRKSAAVAVPVEPADHHEDREGRDAGEDQPPLEGLRAPAGRGRRPPSPRSITASQGRQGYADGERARPSRHEGQDQQRPSDAVRARRGTVATAS